MGESLSHDGLRLDELAATIVRTIQDPLLVLDGDLQVQVVNPAFYETFQLPPDEVEGRCLWEVGGESWDIPDLREQLGRILSNGNPVVDFDLEHTFTGVGARHLRVTGRRIQRDDGDLILLAMADVTAEVEAKQVQEELVEKLEASNADLERFAYIASHDLQEPLRMIASYTELLQRRYGGELDERADKYISYAADGARRMQSMIEGLLQWSRAARAEREFEPVDLNRVLDWVRRDLSMLLADAGADLDAEPLPTVRGEEDQLAQVFRNLISNAIKFQGEEPPRIRITVERQPDEGLWRIGVHDNGMGIESEYFDDVFVLFKRLNPRRTHPGAGLGLALVRKIIEAHGGRMELESELGVGSSFFILLPIMEDDHGRHE